MAGISCAPFRVLAHELGNPAYCVSEMVSAHNLVNPRVRSADKFKRYIYKDPAEGIFCMQLSGDNPIVLAEASKIAVDLGADMIDLNCGCPKRKIRKKGCGSKHLEDLDNLKRCVSAMYDAVSIYNNIPLTVKIRLSDNNYFNNNFDNNYSEIDIVKMLESIGVSAISVHGRSWRQGYDEGIDYSRIKKIVDSVNIPIIGNGDIKDKNTLDKMKDTGCSGFMIARSSIGNPWIFKRLKEGLGDNKRFIISKEIIKYAIDKHYRGLCDFGGSKCAQDQMFRIEKSYIKNMANLDFKI